MKSSNIVSIDTLLRGHTAGVRKLAWQLVRVARRCAPKAEEKVYLGWHNVIYCYGGMKNIACILAPYKSYVNVFVKRHPSVPDPSKRLEGTSKVMGHIKIRTLVEARDSNLARMMKASANVTKH